MNLQQLTRYLLLGGIGLAAFVALPAYADAATLSLSPSSGTKSTDGTFEVKILLDTGSSTTSGTDAYIRFDPNVLQVVDASTAETGVQIQPGSLYSITSYNRTDNATGQISFSASKSGGSPGYSGSGTLATITFQAIKAASSSAVTFDFTNGSTTDSNVIDQSSSQDLLTSVTNASFAVTDSGSSDDGLDDDSSQGGGATGNDGTDGTGGSGTVASSGIELDAYMIATIVALLGAGYFLVGRPRPSRSRSR